MNAGAAQAWFVVGAIVFMVAGGVHAIQALRDTVRPRVFAPIERPVKPAMEGLWFYVPAIITGTATACFTVAVVLSAAN